MQFTFSDYLRSSLLILGAVAQVVGGAIPPIMGWEHSVGSRSYEVQTLVVPAGYAFSIWSILFLGCLIFSVVHALPRYNQDPIVKKVAWLAIIAFWGNTIWEMYVPTYSFDFGSTLIIIIIFAALISILFILKEAKDNRWFFIPLLMLAGWISVATIVNISVSFYGMGYNIFGISPQVEAIASLLTAGLVTITIAFYFGSVYYHIPTTWGFVAIYVINMSRGEAEIAYLALLIGLLGFVIALVRGVRLQPFRLVNQV